MKQLSRKIVLIAVMAATIIGGKFALLALPNVEIVTLLCALYGYIFGALGMAAVLVYILCDTILLGFGTFTLSYFIYWQLVCAIFWLFSALKIKNVKVFTLAALLLTIFFGILTALIDVGLFSGFFDNFRTRFLIYYSRGIVFYIVHCVTNLATFLFVFKPLHDAICKRLTPHLIIG